MFHFSTDRLAGLDTMVLKITASPKVSTMLVPNHSLHHHDASVPVKKLKKRKPRTESRPPLTDMTASNNLPPRPTSPMILHVSSPPREVDLPSPSPDIPSFRPLPPLPSASTLQLPSFLNFSTQSLDSPADPPPRRSSVSLPASALFRVSSSPVPSSHRAVIRKTKKSKALEGPQWIPAFHHPNSPYVPWSPPVRRRILPPTSPLPPSPLSFSSPRIRSGAVAPEPWASSTFSQAHSKSRKERLSSSWKSFKSSIKNGVKSVISHLGRSTKSLRTLCTGRDVLRNFDDTAIVHPDAMQAIFPNPHSRASHDSLASFVSSDSKTLAAWLEERRAIASSVADNIPIEMSVEEYELIGSWLDLRNCDGGWLCGIQDCDTHTAGGSPCAPNDPPSGLRTAMPFDSTDLLSEPSPTPPPAWPFPVGSFTAQARFYSLPRLPCHSFNTHSAQEAEPTTLKNAERCMTRCRELSMPGGWTF